MSKNIDLSEFKKESLDWNKTFSNITGKSVDFPKYTTQLLNIANQNAQGTRPKVVGQLSELIQKCPDKTYQGWKDWYLENHPEAIDKAVDKVFDMIQNFREALEKIDKKLTREWVRDLVLAKTAEGLIIQEAILKHLAEINDTSYELAGPSYESKNIDGFIGEQAVSIKPVSYLSKKSSVRETIPVVTVFYKKTRKYLHIYTPEKFDQT